MTELGAPWDDPNAEYAALTELLLPAAHGRYEQALDAWDATETKALGFLAIAVAIIAGLTSARGSLAGLWWLPAFGCVAASVLLLASLWPRTLPRGPDLFDLHDEMRGSTLLDAARTTFAFLIRAGTWSEQTVTRKTNTYSWGLIVLSISAAVTIPVIVWSA